MDCTLSGSSVSMSMGFQARMLGGFCVLSSGLFLTQGWKRVSYVSLCGKQSFTSDLGSLPLTPMYM